MAPGGAPTPLARLKTTRKSIRTALPLIPNLYVGLSSLEEGKV